MKLQNTYIIQRQTILSHHDSFGSQHPRMGARRHVATTPERAAEVAGMPPTTRLSSNGLFEIDSARRPGGALPLPAPVSALCGASATRGRQDNADTCAPTHRYERSESAANVKSRSGKIRGHVSWSSTALAGKVFYDFAVKC